MKPFLLPLLITCSLALPHQSRADEIDQKPVRSAAPTQIMRVFLQNPGYRGFILKGRIKPWQAALTLNLPADQNGQIWTIRSEIHDAQHLVAAVPEIRFTAPAKEQAQQWTPPRSLPVGAYTWRFQLSNPQSAVVETANYALQVVDKLPKIYIDDRQRLIEDGRPFFPLGIYLNPIEDEDLARVAAAGFNTILSYSYGEEPNPDAYLNRALKHGLRVIYSIKDLYEGTAHFPSAKGKSGLDLARDYILRFRNHPALLGWYVNDEYPVSHVPQLKQMYELVKELDPDHPTLMVTNHADELDPYFDTTDVIAVDPYPVPRHPLTTVSDWTDYATRSARGAKGVWVVPQIMAWSVYDSEPAHRAPTLAEMRNMSYLALIHEAQGLIFYQYFDLWSDIGRGDPNPEIFAKRWPLVASLAREINGLRADLSTGQPIKISPMPANSPIHLRVLKTPKQLLILAANPTTESQTVFVPLPGKWTVARRQTADIGGKASQTGLQLTISAQGSGVFRLDLH